MYLKPHCWRDSEAAKDVQCALQHTSLRDVTSSTEIYYDPDPTTTIIDEDLDLVRAFTSLEDEATCTQLTIFEPITKHLLIEYFDLQWEISLHGFCASS